VGGVIHTCRIRWPSQYVTYGHCLILCRANTTSLEYTNVKIIDMETQNKLGPQFMKKIQGNIPVIVGRFIKYHKPMNHLVVFPWLECVPVHAKMPLSWIKGLVGSRLNKQLNNHLFGYMQFFHMFLSNVR